MIVSFQRKKKVKTKDLQSPWLTKGIRTLSKRKKRLYEKVLKKRNWKSELETKNFQTLFLAVKKYLRKLHFSRLILKSKDNIKKSWEVIK